MSSRPWYKCYPSDYLAGTAILNAEQTGVYSTILNMIYHRGGVIDNSAQDLARICGCTTRRYNKILDELVNLHGKLTLEDGKIGNERALKELKNGEKEREKLQKNGRKGAEKTNENKSQYNENNDITKKGPPEKNRPNPDTRNQIPDNLFNIEDITQSSRARNGEPYAFSGDVISLTADDYEKLKNTYHAIPDFNSALTAIDASFDGEPPKKWWGIMHAKLDYRHRQNYDPNKKPANETRAEVVQY